MALAILALGAPAVPRRSRRSRSSSSRPPTAWHSIGTVSGEAPLRPRPLIVEYSPYGQGPGGPPAGPDFNYVQVHARGTGASGGAWDIMGAREQLDIAREPALALRPAVELRAHWAVRLLGQRHRRLPRHASRGPAVRQGGRAARRHELDLQGPHLHRRHAQLRARGRRHDRHRERVLRQPARALRRRAPVAYRGRRAA